MAFHVARRTNEFGVGIALGAHRANLVWIVLSDVIVMLFVGAVLGMLAAGRPDGGAALQVSLDLRL